MTGLVRIIDHWTAGSYNVNATDKEHYHFIIDGDGDVIAGDHPPEANISTDDADGYAAHTKGTNTGAIGVSMACMASAVENPFSAGPYPMKKIQWDTMVRVNADLCKKYGIPVTPKTVLTHAEVQNTLGKPQNGKWDITRLPFDPSVVGATAVGDKLRREVSALLSGITPPVSPPDMRDYVTREELAALLEDMAKKLR